MVVILLWVVIMIVHIKGVLKLELPINGIMDEYIGFQIIANLRYWRIGTIKAQSQHIVGSLRFYRYFIFHCKWVKQPSQSIFSI